MQPALSIGDQTIEAGNRGTVDLPLPYFYTHSPITMPIHVLRLDFGAA